MNFEDFIRRNLVRKATSDTELAKSLITESYKILKVIKELNPSDANATLLMRECYESFRQICEAIAVYKGYKIYSHEAITAFIAEILNEKEIAESFDRYRKIRNSINYYGTPISLAETQKALVEIPKFIDDLKKKYLFDVLRL
ncbi:hypothetical protein HYW20_06215 [Candidatus Woesearchaeota archaeon]|nr:hypothetical protein [Candidatus Woesearchaeota archaeon]